MDKQRHHRRQIVGWWLDVDPATLRGVSRSEIDGHFYEITTAYERVVEDSDEEELVARGAHEGEKNMQLGRLEKVLQGKSITEIALEEHVGAVPIRASIRYALARLALLTRDD